MHIFNIACMILIFLPKYHDFHSPNFQTMTKHFQTCNNNDNKHLLRPGKLQVATIGILPNKRSQLAHYCLVWRICIVYGPTTIGQVTIKSYFTSYGPVQKPGGTKEQENQEAR